MSQVHRALTLAAQSVGVAAATGVSAVLAFAYLLLTARMVGPTRFADLSVCLSLTYLLGLFFLAPLNLTLIRFSSTYRAADAAARIRPLLRRAAGLYAPWAAGAVVAAMALAVPIASLLNVGSAWLVPWTAVFIALGFVIGALRAVAMGMHQYGMYTRSLLAENITRVVAGLSLVAAYRTAGAALAGFLIGSLAAVAILLPRTHRLLPTSEDSWKDAPDVSRFMVLALVFAGLGGALQNVDMLAAKIRLSPHGAGDYAVALAVARGFLILAAPFSGISLSRGVSKDAGVGLVARTMGSPLAAYVAVCAPVVALLVLVPEPSLRALYGQSTAAQAQLLPILSIGYVLAGAFLILAQRQITLGQFGFLAPLGLVLTAEVVMLGFGAPSALRFGRIVLMAHGAAIVGLLLAPAAARTLGRGSEASGNTADRTSTTSTQSGMEGENDLRFVAGDPR